MTSRTDFLTMPACQSHTSAAGVPVGGRGPLTHCPRRESPFTGGAVELLPAGQEPSLFTFNPGRPA